LCTDADPEGREVEPAAERVAAVGEDRGRQSIQVERQSEDASLDPPNEEAVLELEQVILRAAPIEGRIAAQRRATEGRVAQERVEDRDLGKAADRERVAPSKVALAQPSRVVDRED